MISMRCGIKYSYDEHLSIQRIIQNCLYTCQALVVWWWQKLHINYYCCGRGYDPFALDCFGQVFLLKALEAIITTPMQVDDQSVVPKAPYKFHVSTEVGETIVLWPRFAISSVNRDTQAIHATCKHTVKQRKTWEQLVWDEMWQKSLSQTNVFHHPMCYRPENRSHLSAYSATLSL